MFRMSDEPAAGIESGASDNPFAAIGNGVEVIDPATATGSGDSTAAGTDGIGNAGNIEPVIVHRRRGRKPGSKNSSTKKSAAIDLGGLDAILFSIHLALSAIAKSPELALDEAEAKKLAEAIATVQAQYDVTMNPKMLAWSQFIVVAGAVYAPRAIAISMRIKREKVAKRPSNVVAPDFGHAST